MDYSDNELSEIFKQLDIFVQQSNLAAVHELAGAVLGLADVASDPAERDFLLGMADVLQCALSDHHKVRATRLRLITGGSPTDP